MDLENTVTASVFGGKTPDQCPGYYTKQYDGEALMILEP